MNYKRDYADIYLRSSNGSMYYPAHKYILACKSDVFARTFENKQLKLFDKIKDNKEVYQIGDSCDQSLDLFLLYFYVSDFELVNIYSKTEWNTELLHNVCDLLERYCTSYEYILQQCIQKLFTKKIINCNEIIEICLLYNYQSIFKNLIFIYMDSHNDFELSKDILDNQQVRESILCYILSLHTDNDIITSITHLLNKKWTSPYRNLLNYINDNINPSILSANLININWYNTIYPHLLVLDKHLNDKTDDILLYYPLVLQENKISTISKMDDENVIICESGEFKNNFYAIKHNDVIYWGDYSQKVIVNDKMYIKIKNLHSTNQKITEFPNFTDCNIYSVYI